MLMSSRMQSKAPRASNRFSSRRKPSTFKEKQTTALHSPPPNKAVNANSSKPSRRELEQVFKKFDENNDGKISQSELQSVIGSLGQKSSEEEIKSMMKEADSDGDGFINFGEFFDANTKGVDAARELKDLENAFKMFDLDNDGNICAEELYKALKNLGEVSSLQECRQMIKGVDKSANGSISFPEFKQMMTTPAP